MALLYADGHGLLQKRFPADWTNGRGAGPVRNAKMVSYCRERQEDFGDEWITLAFPAANRKSNGTKGTMRLAKRAGCEVFEYALTIPETLEAYKKAGR